MIVASRLPPKRCVYKLLQAFITRETSQKGICRGFVSLITLTNLRLLGGNYSTEIKDLIKK
ncbi:hypothetical protein BKH40_08440 [Helicobacter sp. 11S02629-2]|nr:hypothetical protein BKH40_08440 [Helicobacter sp. 11S02629-2]